MEKLFVIIVDDQREVLTTVSNDLEDLGSSIYMEECESPSEAWDLIEEIDANGDFPAVVISDHVMPEKTGVEFLSELSEDSRFKEMKKILLTGLATHSDTINAINQASIQRYVEKPWKKEELLQMTKTLLTEFILDKGIDYTPYSEITDQNTILKFLRDNV